MTITEKQKIWDWFTEYIAGFNSQDQQIQLNYDMKKDHSFRVVDNMCLLTKAMALFDNERNIAETIALLHDTGRFEQFRDYQTYSDMQSVNHAELGAEILQRYNILDFLDAKESEYILKSIRYHNRAKLPDDRPKDLLLFARLIRDADKLDIWKVVTDYFCNPNSERNNAMEFALSPEPMVSEQVAETILNGGYINYKHLVYLNDMKLAMSAWVFDLNFDHSITLLLERDYLTAIRSLLPDLEYVDRIYEKIYQYIEEKHNITINI